MECVGTSLGQNARGNVKMACVLQKLPCFGQRWSFCVFGCLRAYGIVYLTLGNMKNLVEMNTKFGFIRLKSYGLFAQWLVFEVKVRSDHAKVVHACILAAQSWWTLPDIRGLCLQQKAWCNAQEKQNCKSCALCKWHCCLFAKNGFIHCAKLHWSE